MAPSFGTWFLNYPGNDPDLSQLQVHWETRLKFDYLPPYAFQSAEDVSDTLKHGFSNKAHVEELVHRAWAEYCTDTGFNPNEPSPCRPLRLRGRRRRRVPDRTP